MRTRGLLSFLSSRAHQALCITHPSKFATYFACVCVALLASGLELSNLFTLEVTLQGP